MTKANGRGPARSDPILSVALAADEIYALPLAVAVRSLVDHLGDRRLRVYIIEGELTQATKSRLRSSWPSTVESHFLRPDPKRLGGLPLSWDPAVSYINRSAYLRLFAPDLLPTDCRKVLYLDVDILALSDVTDLWKTDLENHPIAAAQDEVVRVVSSPKAAVDYESLGLRSDTKYFNSGMLLMNLDVWRAENLSAKVIDYVVRNQGKVRLPDQDGLNAVLAGRWKQLDSSWNHLVSEPEKLVIIPPGEFDGGRDGVPPPEVRILHFGGPTKPWMHRFTHRAYQELYHTYQRRTAWSDSARM